METAEEFYGEKVDAYDRVHYSHGEELEEIGEIFSWYRKKGARILDLGCGSGLHALRLAEMGYRVTGIDRSAKAIEAARKRAGDAAGLRFVVSDIEKDSLVFYGVHDLVTSLGNTVSHLSRGFLPTLFDRVRRALAPGGVFLFNALYWSGPARKNFVERGPDGEVSIVWERTVREEKGVAVLKGHFLKEGITQTLELPCYKVPEVMNLLDCAGFSGIRWSNRLDFRGRTLAGANTIYYRAHNAR